jgi:hypothetical protein
MLIATGEPPPREYRVAIANLRPTQMTVGYAEVAHKRFAFRNRRDTRRLAEKVVPVVVGPRGVYVLDRHHWICAGTAEGARDFPVRVKARLETLSEAAFWSTLDERGWCHPYDSEGRRQDHSAIPELMSELQDDPFRSLVGSLRRAGVIDKTRAPYSDFAWANVLRHRISRSEIESDYAATLKNAKQLVAERRGVEEEGGAQSPSP